MTKIIRVPLASGKTFKIHALDIKDMPALTRKQREVMLNRAKGTKPVDRMQVEKLKADMENGTFDNAQGSITFNKRKELVDGKCRIMASLEAEYPLRQVVFSGASSDVSYVKDTGLPRNIAQLLNKMGYKQPKMVATVARMLCAMSKCPDDDKDGIVEKYRIAITNQEILDTIEQHPGIQESAKKIVPMRHSLPINAISYLVLLDYICRLDGDAKKADKFLKIFTNEEPASKDNPVRVLRTRVASAMRKDKHGLTPSKQAIMMIIAYNMFRSGKKCTRFRIPSEIPRLELKNN